VSYDVTLTLTVDLPAVAGRLLDDERRVLVAHERRLLREVKDDWTGWAYAGRPAAAPRLVSHDAWRTELQTSKAPFALILINEARSYNGGKPYVANVHRAGITQPEWERLFLRIGSDYLPPLVVDLRDAILKNFGTPRPVKKVRLANKGVTTRVGGGGVVL